MAQYLGRLPAAQRVTDDQPEDYPVSSPAASSSSSSAERRDPTTPIQIKTEPTSRFSERALQGMKWPIDTIPGSASPGDFKKLVLNQFTRVWFRFNYLFYQFFKGSNETYIPAAYADTNYTIKGPGYSILRRANKTFKDMPEEAWQLALITPKLKLYTQTPFKVQVGATAFNVLPFSGFEIDDYYFDEMNEYIKFELNPRWFEVTTMAFRQKAIEMFRALFLNLLAWNEEVIAGDRSSSKVATLYASYIGQDTDPAKTFRSIHNQFMANLELNPDFFQSLIVAVTKTDSDVLRGVVMLGEIFKQFEPYYEYSRAAFEYAKNYFAGQPAAMPTPYGAPVHDPEYTPTSRVSAIPMENGAPLGFHADKVAFANRVVIRANQLINKLSTGVSREAGSLIDAELDKIINEIEKFKFDNALFSKNDPNLRATFVAPALKLEKVIVYLMLWGARNNLIADYATFFGDKSSPTPAQIRHYLITRGIAYFLQSTATINTNFKIDQVDPRYNLTDSIRGRIIFALESIEPNARMAAQPKKK